MKKVDGIKTIKIAAGCCLSYLIAEGVGLQYSNSVITITLLSILGTRRDTFRTAGKRWAAFGTALLVGAAAFWAIPVGEYPSMAANLFLYLSIFLILCQRFGLMEGFSMSTVLMLHLWRLPKITLGAVGNEAALMAIGVFMGIAANLYMPDRVGKIRKAQEMVEEHMRAVFYILADEIDEEDPGRREGLSRRGGDILKELKALLKEGLSHAEYTEKNYIFRNSSAEYYRRYMEMREEQRQLLKRIRVQILRLRRPYAQSRLVASFMRGIAGSLAEHDNAEELLFTLETVREQCRGQELPENRAEFEDRARLFGIVGLLEELLLLKKDFAGQLTPEEIRRFWKFFLP